MYNQSPHDDTRYRRIKTIRYRLEWIQHHVFLTYALNLF